MLDDDVLYVGARRVRGHGPEEAGEVGARLGGGAASDSTGIKGIYVINIQTMMQSPFLNNISSIYGIIDQKSCDN